MSDGVKIMALGCLAVSLCVTVLVVPDNAFLIKTLAIGLCSVAGVPAVAAGLRMIKKGQ